MKNKPYLESLIHPQGIDCEPYSVILTSLQLTSHNKEDEVTINQQRRQTQKFNFFLNSFDFLTDNKITGSYFEFGCHKARTFRMALTAAKFYNLQGIEFHAFDSFKGLPDIGKCIIEKWLPGELCTNKDQFQSLIDQHGLFLNSVYLHEGFYNELLNKEFQTQLMQISPSAAFINIDCDFYESAVDVFNFIEPFLQHGSIIYIDDFFGGFKLNSNGGVKQAFNEFRMASNFDFIEHMNCGWWGKSF